MRRSIVMLIAAGFLIGSARLASAEEPPTRCPICRRANNQALPYPEKATMTLVRGVTNTAFGWTELLTEPAAEAEQSGNLLTGIGKGVTHAVGRTAAGLGEMLTFWVPKGQQGYPTLTKDCPICAKHR